MYQTLMGYPCIIPGMNGMAVTGRNGKNMRFSRSHLLFFTTMSYPQFLVWFWQYVVSTELMAGAVASIVLYEY
jgi:hypothetical protein